MAKLGKKQTENFFIAEKLSELADLLEQQNASRFRIDAYREASAYILSLPYPVHVTFVQNGRAGLEDMPTIGPSIAELLDTGALGTIERLRGSIDPEKLFQTVPMIGPRLAHVIHETLGLDTLEALETAAFDGRLEAVKGMGKRRIDSIRHSLNDMLARRRPRISEIDRSPPPIADILSVDQEYRTSAEAETLPTIKPRRMNENGEMRIPILHTQRGKWHFTALYSNTVSAHQYGKTRDWVVIYYECDGHPEGQSTAVTEHGGPLHGMRVIRGQEKACQLHYKVQTAPLQRPRRIC
jgi:hypothetical protein